MGRDWWVLDPEWMDANKDGGVKNGCESEASLGSGDGQALGRAAATRRAPGQAKRQQRDYEKKKRKEEG